jgi:hypothetical protein
MFGMLDYRAAKLFWLLTLPIRFVAWFMPWLSIALAVLVASERFSDYSWWARIGIALATYFITNLVIHLILTSIVWCLKQGFMWTIDVVPSKGADPKEAEAVVLGGKFYLTRMKLRHHIEQWTDEDTAYMARQAPWRVRPFFQKQTVERFKERVRVLKENYERTGKQLADLSEEEGKKLIGSYEDPTWQRYFRAPDIITLAIALVCIIIFVH